MVTPPKGIAVKTKFKVDCKHSGEVWLFEIYTKSNKRSKYILSSYCKNFNRKKCYCKILLFSKQLLYKLNVNNSVRFNQKIFKSLNN